MATHRHLKISPPNQRVRTNLNFLLPVLAVYAHTEPAEKNYKRWIDPDAVLYVPWSPQRLQRSKILLARDVNSDTRQQAPAITVSKFCAKRTAESDYKACFYVPSDGNHRAAAAAQKGVLVKAHVESAHEIHLSEFHLDRSQSLWVYETVRRERHESRLVRTLTYGEVEAFEFLKKELSERVSTTSEGARA